MSSPFFFKDGNLSFDSEDEHWVRFSIKLSSGIDEIINIRILASDEVNYKHLVIKIDNWEYLIYPSKTVILPSNNQRSICFTNFENLYDEYSIICKYNKGVVYLQKNSKYIQRMKIKEFPVELIICGGRMLMERMKIERMKIEK